MHCDFRYRRRGFTLMEIMVVLVIVMLLAVMVLQAVRPALESRRMREAARTITSMLYQAKSRAIATGRPVGVWFERNQESADPASRVLYYAESPPIYAGDSEDAKADVKEGGSAMLTGANTSLIRAGDLIRFNYQDPWYEIVSAGSSVQFKSMTPGGLLPKPTGDKPMSAPFQILRKPRQAMGTPVQLTGNIVVDLSQSGMGATGQDFRELGKKLIIMFSPNGHVHGVYMKDNQPGKPPISPIHLLVGKNEKIGGKNLTDSMNMWISIGNQSGLITSGPINVAESGQGGSLKDSREDAISMLSTGE